MTNIMSSSRVILFLFLSILLGLSDSTSAPASASSPASSSSSSSEYDFEKMSNLIRRLDVLESDASEILMGFYEPRTKTFQTRPGCGTTTTKNAMDDQCDNICITSTCYALLIIAQFRSGVYDSVVAPPISCTTDKSQEDRRKVSFAKSCDVLCNANFREDDRFQVPLLLYTLLRLNREDPSVIRTDDKAQAAKLRKMIEIVLNERPRRRAGMRQQNSDYVAYQVCKVCKCLQELESITMVDPNDNKSNKNKDRRIEGNICVARSPTSILSDGLLADDVFYALLSCSDVSVSELCRQLAYRSAGDSSSFDVIRLAYSLLTYIRSTKSLSGIAGKELIPGEGPSPETRVAPLNKKLIAAAVAAFFAEQNSNGLWDRGQPIYKTLGGGRTVGNAFVFPVNTVGSLLYEIRAELFRPHLAALEKTLAWIETHETVQVIGDYTDETGRCYGNTLRGWSAPELDQGQGPQAWPTAQVLKCVSSMKNTIRQLMHTDVLEEFDGKAFSKDGVQTDSWDRLLDSDLSTSSQSEDERRTLKSVLEERVIRPFENSIDNPDYGAAYSAILFGPPGTAKTTICAALAQRMGYDFVVIDTAAFLADGLSNVSARIRYVFKRLMALKKCVILFDEIEEFALDRETAGLSMESRMLTTAMLTAINDLRGNQQSIFFIATNRLRAFDSAITRPGRFDMTLFVGTPNLESRMIQFQQALDGKVDTTVMETSMATFRKFLESVWSQDIMFMNFLEGKQFASACANIVTSSGGAGGSISSKEMASILKKQAAVMTVRGAAREEHLTSMELSRF